MLREMFDAAGDAGEFYTPRAVVRFIVEAVHPRIGETVLDPACGSGGFLAEAYAHLEKQCRTVEHLPPEQILARIRGREAEIQAALDEIEGILGQDLQDGKRQLASGGVLK